MKKKRLETILKLIEKYNISTQEELMQRLNDNGFKVTQATVSRDINELRIVKVMGAGGNYRYVANQADSDELLAKFKTIFIQSVISSDYAGNTIVIKCYTGMAQAACAAFDSMHWEGLVGTLAGDDTIFALCRTEGYASQMKDSIQRLLGK
ncbi:MAG TPA: arginine repressor [Clostridiales bacterium]|nr:arginine repressor [Clostridiales bacterium]HRT81678.1 arginine repressor [Oscillospiraceae bacterium]